LVTTWQLTGRRGGWKPFLHHLSKGRSQPGRAIALKAPGKLPRVLTVAEAQAILDACDHLRDRFLLAILWDGGLRIGEALGLRHEDISPPLSARSRSWRGSMTTGPAPSRATNATLMASPSANTATSSAIYPPSTARPSISTASESRNSPPPTPLQRRAVELLGAPVPRTRH
jgi:hypothetical protein